MQRRLTNMFLMIVLLLAALLGYYTGVSLQVTLSVAMLSLVFGVTNGDLRLYEDFLAYASSIAGVSVGILLMLAGLLIPAFIGFGVATIFVYRLVNVARWYRNIFHDEAYDEIHPSV